jgi:hypothetical protein
VQQEQEFSWGSHLALAGSMSISNREQYSLLAAPESAAWRNDRWVLLTCEGRIIDRFVERKASASLLEATRTLAL